MPATAVEGRALEAPPGSVRASLPLKITDELVVEGFCMVT
jgi:hypothetical protein